jgi:Uma2 family endonuclease
MSAIAAIEKKTVQPKIYTLEEYLQREERSLSKNEFYNGQIIPMPGAKYNHNKIATNTIIALDKVISTLTTYHEVLNSDQKVYIVAENTAVYPDALVICEKPEFWQGREDLITNPILIVEILSKSTRKYDLKDKFSLYQLIPSFREYITIEQNKPQVQAWFMQDEETWKVSKASDLTQTIHIRSLNIDLNLSDIYRRVEFGKK